MIKRQITQHRNTEYERYMPHRKNGIMGVEKRFKCEKRRQIWKRKGRRWRQTETDWYSC